ncbi:DUF5819 family protein [Streptacidiphilus sp. N1-3]|uniref:DUF5819 family protein n=1 Tax=Streptacidiphilus alkalitolerans TaxID=3342712 RepID=A0ABV6WZD8_9ACTN
MSEQPQPDTSIPGPALPAQAALPEQPAEPEHQDVPAQQRWSLPSRMVLAGAAAVLLLATCWHLGTVFLAIAPGNPASHRYSAQISAHVYPEFEQNWQLFAPNPLQDNIAVQARVQTLTAEGGHPQSGWTNLTAHDIAAVRGDLAPSHVDQNQLRRAWDYFSTWHSLPSEDSLGSGGPLSKEYLKRIALQRIGRDWDGSPVNQIQFRIATTPVAGPAWTQAQLKPKTTYQTLQWWVVGDEDYTGLLP